MLSVSRPHRVRRREVLRDRHERHAGCAEALHHLGEVEERAAEAVDLVDDHDVDLAGVDVGEQALERGAVGVGAGEAAVVVALADELPAGLMLDVADGGLALRVEGVEVLLEPGRRRFARVDCAALQLGRDVPCRLHRAPPPARPKKKR